MQIFGIICKNFQNVLIWILIIINRSQYWASLFTREILSGNRFIKLEEIEKEEQKIEFIAKIWALF